MKDKFAAEICNEDANNPEIGNCDHEAWNKSLVRCVIQMILRFFARIQRLESSNDLVNGSASILSKREFFLRLAEVMTVFRRKEGDTSKAIIWKTQPKRRLGNQFNADHQCKGAFVGVLNSVG
jgi:hypothetical protein